VGRPGGTVTGPIQPGPHPADDPSLWDPLAIEVTQLDGEPQVVTWLGPAAEVDRPINALPTAKAPVVLYDGYLLNRGTEDDPDPQRLDVVLPDDAIVTISTARPSPEQNVTLFRGYLNTVRRTAAGAKQCGIELVHVADDLKERAIHGQLWLSKADEVTFAESSTPTLIPKVDTGWPVVFNPEGAKNCRKKLTYLDDADTEWRFGVPLWAHRYYDDRQAWTWARVFMFLLYWGRRLPDGTLGAMPHDLVDCNLWKLIYERGYHLEDPDELGGGVDLEDPWARVLLARPLSHAIEGMDWIQALKWTCARSGIGFTVDAWHESDGALKEGFRFFVPGASRRVTIRMPSAHFRTDDKTWTEVRREADVSNLAVVGNYAACVNAARAGGAAKRYEVTVELVPGWDYDAERVPQVDVDPDDQNAVAEAVAAISSDAWGNRYCTNGKQFFDHWSVLRHWIAPDFADMRDTDKVRPFGYFVAAAYEALDLADLEVGEVQDGDEFQHDRNSLRPRPIKRCLTGVRPGQTFPPIVQVSYRSGEDGSWFPLPADVKVLMTRLGVFMEMEDLRVDGLKEPGEGASTYTLPEAYIRGTMRMRITGVIESDNDFVDDDYEGWTEIPGSLSRRRRGRLLFRPGDFRWAIREDRGGHSGGNSIFKGSEKPATEEFLEDAARLVNKYLHRADRVRHVGPVVMTGLLFPEKVGGEVIGFRPGDEVPVIAAEDQQHAHDIDLRARQDDDYAIIANVNWRWNPGDGDKVSPELTTTLTLEDPAAVVGFGEG